MDLMTVKTGSVIVVIIVNVYVVAIVSGQSLDMPEEIFRDMASMLLGALDVIVSGCDPINPDDIEYLYYNKQNSNSPIKLNLTNIKEELIPKLRTKIIIHGWYGTATGPNAQAMKDAYLKKGNYNLIFVNWETHASVNYAQAHCALSTLGETVGDFVFDMYRIAKLKLRKMHLIGHSLGAHMAGYVGQRIQQRTGGSKVARITGLDAAGPGFVGFHQDSRLDQSDAQFVDAIHTNGAQFGYPRNYGTVDFYPNCGLFQPGCLELDLSDNATILKQTLDNLSCSHNRSMEYFIESINSRKFIATPFDSCYLFHQCRRTSDKIGIIMGDDCPKNVSGSYCLVTNLKPPFARG